MGETLEEQFQKAIKKKNEQGESSDMVEMAKKAIEKKANPNSLESEGINTVTSDEIFGKEQQKDPEKNGRFEVDGLFVGNEGTQAARERYERDIRDFITEKGAESTEEVGQAVEEYFKKNKAKGETKTGKMILGNLEQLRLVAGANPEENPADSETNIEAEKEKGENKDESVEAPKTLEEFRSKFQVSGEFDKKFYNNNKTGVDLEISGYDSVKGEVIVIFHEHSKIESQEDGKNVLVLDEEPDGKKEKSRSEKISFAKFQEMMKDYVLEIREADNELVPKKIENKKQEQIMAVPGKTYRNKGREKIKVLEFNPKLGDAIRTGEARILRLIPENNEGKKRTRKEYQIIEIEKLRQMLAEDGYQEIQEARPEKTKKNIEAGRKEKEIEIELEPEKTVEIENNRDQNEGDKKDEEKSKELNNELNKENKELGNEQERQEQLNEKELKAIEYIYIPYAQECLDMINSYDPDGYKEEDVELFRQEEKKRFFSADGGVLASRIAESEFIRKEAVKKALEYVQATVEQEPIGDYSI